MRMEGKEEDNKPPLVLRICPPVPVQQTGNVGEWVESEGSATALITGSLVTLICELRSVLLVDHTVEWYRVIRHHFH